MNSLVTLVAACLYHNKLLIQPSCVSCVIVIWKVVGEFARYSSIYVFDTKRCTTRFKVRKALNNKFVCVVIICKFIEIGCL